MKVYPSRRYHPEKDPVLVMSAEHEQAMGPGWFHSPADFGVETEPGATPDPAIAAKKLAYEKSLVKDSRKAPKAKEGNKA